jgi:hypothetical protein
MILYDLAAADKAVCFSPHCWKTRYIQTGPFTSDC